MRIGPFIWRDTNRAWSNRRWANTPKWLFGIETWLDSLRWGSLHFGWFINPRSLTIGISWDIISDNWIGTKNELLIHLHPFPMMILYVSFAIPERWVKRQVGTSQVVAGCFRR